MPVITRFPGGGITKCKQITNFTVIVGLSVKGQVELTWKNPSDDKLKGIEIFYKEGSEVTKYGDGVKCFDSNDGDIPESIKVDGLTEKQLYYFRAFTYTYKNATRIYNETKEGAYASGAPYRLQGKEYITSSGQWTVPDKVEKIDVFIVGAGGSAQAKYSSSWDNSLDGGGGAGYTKTIKGIAVTPGEKHNIVIGAGKAYSAGGKTSFDSYSVDGGEYAEQNAYGTKLERPGKGGSAGGWGGAYSDSSSSWNGVRRYDGQPGASDGGSSRDHSNPSHSRVVDGQGTTTREFGEPEGKLYAGGGGGSGYGGARSHMYNPKPGAGGAGGGGQGGTNYPEPITILGQPGTPNTGGGAGEPPCDGSYGTFPPLAGGSGICVIRWGY